MLPKVFFCIILIYCFVTFFLVCWREKGESQYKDIFCCRQLQCCLLIWLKNSLFLSLSVPVYSLSLLHNRSNLHTRIVAPTQTLAQTQRYIHFKHIKLSHTHAHTQTQTPMQTTIHTHAHSNEITFAYTNTYTNSTKHSL